MLEGVEEPVRWGMVTRADVTISPDGRSATLSHSGKTLDVRLSVFDAAFGLVENVKFEIVPTTPPTEKEAQNQGYKMLAIVAQPTDGQVAIHVVFFGGSVVTNPR
jgi:hypothetical protein